MNSVFRPRATCCSPRRRPGQRKGTITMKALGSTAISCSCWPRAWQQPLLLLNSGHQTLRAHGRACEERVLVAANVFATTDLDRPSPADWPRRSPACPAGRRRSIQVRGLRDLWGRTSPTHSRTGWMCWCSWNAVLPAPADGSTSAGTLRIRRSGCTYPSGRPLTQPAFGSIQPSHPDGMDLWLSSAVSVFWADRCRRPIWSAASRRERTRAWDCPRTCPGGRGSSPHPGHSPHHERRP